MSFLTSRVLHKHLLLHNLHPNADYSTLCYGNGKTGHGSTVFTSLSNSFICCAQNGKCNISAPSVSYLLLYSPEHEYKSINASRHRLPNDVGKEHLLGRLRGTRWTIRSAWPSSPTHYYENVSCANSIVATSRKCLQNDIHCCLKALNVT